MPRRQKSPLDELTDGIMQFPPTVGLIVIAFIFFGLRYAVPYLFQPAAGDPLAKTLPGKVIGTLCFQFAPIFIGILLLVWVAGLIRRLFNHRQLAAQNAARGIRVTSGEFTAEADREFQNNRAIDRIQGHQLEQMIRAAQSPAPRTNDPRPEPKPPVVNPAQLNKPPAAPACPNCQSPMLERTAKKGPNSGGKFWGCPRFPDCRGKREMVG